MYKFLFLIVLAISPALYSQNPEDELNSVKLIISGSKDAEGGTWGKETDEAKLYKNVKIFDEISEDHSKELLKASAKYFNDSFSGFQKYQQKAKEKQEEFDKNPKYFKSGEGDWREKEEKVNQEKQINTIVSKGRKEAVDNLIKAMNTLDKIQNPSVRKNNVYIDLKASIYREYIKHQFNLKNYNQASDIIEKYMKLSEVHEREAQPHKMLAICYEYNQKYAAKYKEKGVYEHFKNLKYEHLLRYTELAYGRESSQYDRVLKKISRN